METSPHQQMAPPRPGLSRGILFPTDFGPAAEGAWPFALALAKALAIPVRVFHVVEAVPTPCAVSPIWGTLGLLEEALRRDAERRLQGMRREAAAAGVGMRAEVVVGRIRPEIRRAVREAGASVIVMGTRPRRGLLLRAMRQSVADLVLCVAPCPVLTVPAGSSLLRRERDPVQRHPVIEQPKAA